MSAKQLWKVRFCFYGLAVLLLCGGRSYGQTQAITATLSGTVVDQSGQTVSGAKVTLNSGDRGIFRSSSTESNGNYSFTLLPPSVYVLQIEAPGFKQYKQEGITLEGGQNVEQNVNLTIGAATEMIEVSSE